MTQQTVGTSRLAQRTAGAVVNANFDELYAQQLLVEVDNAVVAGSFSVPAGYVIESIAIFNNTANAITGGLKFGTAAGGTQVITAQAVGASALLVVADSALTLRAFSTTAAQIVYFDAVTAWNSADIDIRVSLREMWVQ